MTVEQMLEARQAAIDAAEQAANRRWRIFADYLVAQYAATHKPFTSDDIIEALERHDVSTHNLSALGPVFRHASRQGLIVRTGRQVPSRIKRRHRDLVEWTGRW